MKRVTKTSQLLRSTLLYLGIFLIALTLAQPLRAEGKKKTRRPGSYLDYQPPEAQFQGALKPVFSSVIKAQSNPSSTRIQSSLKQISMSKESLSRGYHDELLFLEGFVLELDKQPKKAVEAYNRVLELDNANPVAIFRKALLLEKLQQYDAALAALKEFLWLSKFNQHEALFLQGRCLCKLDRCQEGLESVQAALQLSPQYVPAIEFMVEQKQKSLALIKDPMKKAELEAQIAADLFWLVKFDPSNREAALELARHSLQNSDPLVHAQKLDEAQHLAQNLVSTSAYKDEKAVKLLFDIYIRRGKTELATSTLERGLEANPNAEQLKAAQQQLEIQRQVDEQSAKKLEEEAL